MLLTQNVVYSPKVTGMRYSCSRNITTWMVLAPFLTKVSSDDVPGPLHILNYWHINKMSWSHNTWVKAKPVVYSASEYSTTLYSVIHAKGLRNRVHEVLPSQTVLHSSIEECKVSITNFFYADSSAHLLVHLNAFHIALGKVTNGCHMVTLVCPPCSWCVCCRKRHGHENVSFTCCKVIWFVMVFSSAGEVWVCLSVWIFAICFLCHTLLSLWAVLLIWKAV